MKILFIDQSTGLDTVSDLSIKPRGGMINSLFKITDYLSQKQHDVTVYSDIKERGETNSGTEWANELFDFKGYDCLVTNRGIGDGYPDIEAKKRILWTHDLPHSGFAPTPQTFKAFERVVFMSHYAEKIWREFYKDIGKSAFIPNGVDKLLFKPKEKDLRKIIYFSHPNRGLNKLPLIADSIANRAGDITFDAYSNVSMYPNDKDPRDHGTESTTDYDDSATLNIKEPIPMHELAAEIATAGLMIMPSGYPEICSNNVLQSLACGTPIITTGGLGATPEWVKHGRNGMLTNFLPSDYMIHSVEIVRHAVTVLKNENLHRRLIKAAGKTKIHDWKEIGHQWEKLLLS